MTNDEFCRIMREFDGEPMDKVGQLTYIQFTGEELKEFCDHVESQVKKDLIAGVVGSFNSDDVIEVAEKLYYEANPNTKPDVPSFAYEQTEKANQRRFIAQSKLTLYDWCKQEIA